MVCAELVAAVLRVGGLLTQSSNPGSATPESLHRVFKEKAAVTANPYVLRQFCTNSQMSLGFDPMHRLQMRCDASAASAAGSESASMGAVSRARQRGARRASSPPRASILYRPL